MPEFFRVIPPDELVEALGAFPRLAAERVPLDDALGRTLAADVASPEDLPEGPRATMDGYAVRAADTFGASDSIPALLTVGGAVEMGSLPGFRVGPGQAAPIPTGGFLPEGADAVVMIEYANPLPPEGIEVARPVTAGENVLAKGEDVAAGAAVLAAGRAIGAREIGLLAGLGITELTVVRRPRVAVLSTGDEVVPIDRRPGPGKIRDANAHAVAALVRACGATAIRYDIVPDDPARLRDALLRGLAEADLVVLSGGSSVGKRDLMVDAVGGLPGAEVLAHGVAISPGKPTLLARRDGKAILGLPGHPVSALVVAQVFLAPFLRHLQGGAMAKGPLGPRVRAVLATSLHSAQGREEYVRVRLETTGGRTIARPVFGKSGMLSTLARADGLVVVPIHAEGIAKGDEVEVVLL